MLLTLHKVAFIYSQQSYIPRPDIIHYYRLRTYDTLQVVMNEIKERIDEKDPNPSFGDTVLTDITCEFYAIPYIGGKTGFYVPGIKDTHATTTDGCECWEFLSLSIFPVTTRGNPVPPLISGDYPSHTMPRFLAEHQITRNVLWTELPDLLEYVRWAAEIRTKFMLAEGYA